MSQDGFLAMSTWRKRSFRAGIWKSLLESVSVFFPILTGNTKRLISSSVLIGWWCDEQNCLSTVSFQIFISSNKFGSAFTLSHNLLPTRISSLDPPSGKKLEIIELGWRLLNLSSKMNSPAEAQIVLWRAVRQLTVGTALSSRSQCSEPFSSLLQVPGLTVIVIRWHRAALVRQRYWLHF